MTEHSFFYLKKKNTIHIIFIHNVTADAKSEFGDFEITYLKDFEHRHFNPIYTRKDALTCSGVGGGGAQHHVQVGRNQT